MSRIPKLYSEIYSDELYNFTESEYDEVMQASAVEDEDWQGYAEWSRELEQSAWCGAKAINTAYGQVLVKKACEHSTCGHSKCERGLRIGGIEI